MNYVSIGFMNDLRLGYQYEIEVPYYATLHPSTIDLVVISPDLVLVNRQLFRFD